jgi:hypothetical protein
MDYQFSPMGYSAILALSQRVHLSDSARSRASAMQVEFREYCGTLLKQIRPDVSDEELKVIFFSTQNMLMYSMWRARTRSILPEEDHRDILEKLIWSTMLG